MGRTGRGITPRTPSYPTYTSPSRPENLDVYAAEKYKSLKLVEQFFPTMSLLTRPPRGSVSRSKGMQLGKKSKMSDLFERVRGDLGAQPVENDPALPNLDPVPIADSASASRVTTSAEREGIEITITESISAKISREGMLKSFNVKGDLQLYISDPSLTKAKLHLIADPTCNASFRTHPKVDKALFTNSKMIQLRDGSAGFPLNNSVGVLRWSSSATAESKDILPVNFTVWVNRGTEGSWLVTVEYELIGKCVLRDVAVTIPYASSEPAVSSFDANYEVSGDSLEWAIGTVDQSNATGNFDFEAQAEDEAEFFPMSVRFTKETPIVNVDVSFNYIAP